VVTHQLQVERRTGKVRQSETDVLPLCHATNGLHSTENIRPIYVIGAVGILSLNSVNSFVEVVLLVSRLTQIASAALSAFIYATHALLL